MELLGYTYINLCKQRIYIGRAQGVVRKDISSFDVASSSSFCTLSLSIHAFGIYFLMFLIYTCNERERKM